MILREYNIERLHQKQAQVWDIEGLKSTLSKVAVTDHLNKYRAEPLIMINTLATVAGDLKL